MGRFASSQARASERGQTFLAVLVILGVVLLGILGLATDYSQIWAHRQMAQAAADAACQAGAADLYIKAIDPANPIANFSWIGSNGSSFTCDTNTSSPPCRYASLNGYSTGPNVRVDFLGSLPGVTGIPSGFGTIANPYIKVTITDPVPKTFTRLVSSGNTFSITASAGCGVQPVNVPIPLVVLNQVQSGTLSTNGGPTVQIIGGPNRAIQVDSHSTTAVSTGGSAQINLTQAGPSNTGADFGVAGVETQPGQVLTGTGKWVSPSPPFGDPWITYAAPTAPGVAGTAKPVPLGVNGCPDPNGCVEFTAGNYSACLGGTITPGATGCLVLPYMGSNPKFNNGGVNWQTGHAYALGDIVQPSTPTCAGSSNSGGYLYMVTVSGTSSATCPALFNQTACTRQPDGTCSGGTQVDGGVTWQNVGKVAVNKLSTALFDPGLYFVSSNGLNFGSGSTARMSTALGDGTRGATFYFNSTASVAFNANSGSANACTSATNTGTSSPNGCVVPYKVDGTVSSAATGYVASRVLQCPSGPANPPQVPASIDGNILLGPCSGTYGDASGQNRGFLFFQNRTQSANASVGGGSGFIFSGFMYFHSGNGSTCGSTTSCLSLQGGGGTNSFTLGNIVVDEVSLGGNSSIKMILNPSISFPVLRPTLLQ
jgi:hypothetical protein